MLQPLKLGRFLCSLCKDTVNSSDNVASNYWGVGKRCEGRGGGLIWGIIPIRTCLKEPNMTTKDVNLWNQTETRDLRNTKQDRDIWWVPSSVIHCNYWKVNKKRKPVSEINSDILLPGLQQKRCITSQFCVIHVYTYNKRTEFWTKIACFITSVCTKLVSLWFLPIITQESDVLNMERSLLSLK